MLVNVLNGAKFIFICLTCLVLVNCSSSRGNRYVIKPKFTKQNTEAKDNTLIKKSAMNVEKLNIDKRKPKNEIETNDDMEEKDEEETEEKAKDENELNKEMIERQNNAFLREIKRYVGFGTASYNFDIKEGLGYIAQSDFKEATHTASLTGVSGYAGIKFRFQRGIFIAPEVYYLAFQASQANIEMTKSTVSTVIDAKNEYGGRINIGYELKNNLAIYGIIGYGITNIAIQNKSYSEDKTGYALKSILYGAGASLRLGKLFFNAKYIMRNMNFTHTMLHDAQVTPTVDQLKYQIDATMTSIGVDYVF